MKLVVRAFVLGLFAAGASAAVVSVHSSNTTTMVTSHQAVVAAMPMPGCGPSGGPSCTGTGSGSSSAAF